MHYLLIVLEVIAAYLAIGLIFCGLLLLLFWPAPPNNKILDWTFFLKSVFFVTILWWYFIGFPFNKKAAKYLSLMHFLTFTPPPPDNPDIISFRDWLQKFYPGELEQMDQFLATSENSLETFGESIAQIKHYQERKSEWMNAMFEIVDRNPQSEK
ncbi:MAG: hypothetical protein A2Y67_03235 [Candidatus Buchananbacteria bacterium RBG_13_39_9]|uniref:Uncharacterized protein n=1 Tax=Candidatus Buchananbacteria bacterium RBG_13_39_9 TaxID=1797531 RepID=A0A1G1XPT6_9BACT|nr:MAG: hypothetical protein A2Y67_03235 [Candidatus Buchananbacteria bacterium RBG_13_39_9]